MVALANLKIKRGRENMLQLCGMCVLCVSSFFFKLFVPCQALAEELQRNFSLTDLTLASNNVGPEGAKAWCLVRMVS